MIKQFQMGINLLRYAYGIKTNLLSALLMLVIGIPMEWTTLPVAGEPINSMAGLGGYFIMITAMWPLQMLISLNVPGMVAASPWKKRIQTSVFAISATAYFFVAYAIIVILKMIKYNQGLLSAEGVTLELLQVSALTVLLIIYMAISLKYFVAATIIFLIVMPFSVTGFTVAQYLGWISTGNMTPAAAVLVGFVAIIVSCFVAYGILHLLYRKPISKYSQVTSLRKKM